MQVVGQLGYIFSVVGDDYFGLVVLQLYYVVCQGLKFGVVLVVNGIGGVFLWDFCVQLIDVGDKIVFGDLFDVVNDCFVDILWCNFGVGDCFVNDGGFKVMLMGMFKIVVKCVNSGMDVVDNYNIISLGYCFFFYSIMLLLMLIILLLIQCVLLDVRNVMYLLMFFVLLV